MGATRSGVGRGAGRWARWLRMALALAAVGVLLVLGVRNASGLTRVRLHLLLGWFAVAFPLYAVASLCLALGWRQELVAFGHHVRVGVAVRIWWRAQLARYVPTGLAAFASRAALARDVGVPAALGAASLVIELAALIGWGCLVAGAGLPSAELSTPLRVVLVGGAAAGLVLLPVTYPRVAARGRRMPALDTLASAPGRPADLYGALVLYGASVVCKSASFVAFTAGLLPSRGADAWLLGAAVQAAAVIGIVGVTPAGIGVREGAMIGLLAHRFGAVDAAALAVAWRAWEFAFELGWLALGTVWAPVARPSRARQ